MFSKKQRINREKIGEIIKKPDFSFKSKNFNLKSVSNQLPFPRFCVIISKKFEKSAVKRHFLKRRIFSLIKEVKIEKPDDFVFILTNNITKQNKNDLKKEIAYLFNECIID